MEQVLIDPSLVSCLETPPGTVITTKLLAPHYNGGKLLAEIPSPWQPDKGSKERGPLRFPVS